MKYILKILLCFIIFLFVSMPINASNVPDTKEILTNLTKSYRVAGTLNEKMQSSYIKSIFENFGLKTKTAEFNYIEYMGIYKKNSQNIIGIKPGKNSENTIIICAHYDAVKNSFGAYDNASGIATLINCIKRIQNYNPYNNLEFIAFGAEEAGLYGSYNYVNSLNKNIIGVINIDMIGLKGNANIYTFTGENYGTCL